MKNINWKNIGVIALVAVGVFLFYPRIRPTLQKLPVIGAWL